MKVALITYHSNLYQLYPDKWIEDYRNSIEAQTYDRFDIYEVNYGDRVGMVFFKSLFESVKFPTFVDCMNYMLDKLFNVKKYDYVFNSNIDDVYHPQWVEKTLRFIDRFDLVSCNFKLFNDDGIYHTHNFERLVIPRELARDHNIICHPGVCYSKWFWENCGPYIPAEVPFEDMRLWQRSLAKGAKMYIQPEHLVHHRVHDNSVCKSDNR